MITAESINNGLMTFYLITAIVLLAIAIVAYPSLKDRSKKPR